MDGMWQKLLKVDLSQEKVKEEPIKEEVAQRYLGGNGLGIYILYNEMDGRPSAFAEETPLIFVPGLLNGSGIPLSGKSGFYSKSPLTGIMGEGFFGGALGAEVKKAGYDAVVIKGSCQETSYLLIDGTGAEIKKGTELEGLGTEKTEEILQERHGGSVGVIGPAGENLVLFACIAGDGRQVGRTGLGAVMGSKKLKGIVGVGEKEIVPYDSEQMNALKKKAITELKDGKGKEAYHGYSQYGTAKFSEVASDEFGIFPTEYWRKGSFEHAKDIATYAWKQQVSKKNACYGCIIACGQMYKGLVDVEYETTFSLGSNLRIGDIEEIAKANYLCDDLGLDTLSMGNVIGFLMDLSQRGILKEDLSFGQAETVHELIRKTAWKQGIGKIAAEGVKRIAEKYGAEDNAVHVKGIDPPAYDVRAIKGMGLSFYTSTRGACHLRSDCDGIELGGGTTPNERGEWKNMVKDRLSSEGKEYIAWRENYVTLHDTLGTCKFTRSVYSPSFMSIFVNAYTGLATTGKDLLKIGERIYNLERLYNLSQRPEIKTELHIPKQFTHSSPSKQAQGSSLTREELTKMLQAYYTARGWNEKGEPRPEKLEELEITV
ncbi:MAG: aldehyde ferredoxin oxidoreductase family protein [Candidatus Korarchaeota archaeon]|nr:aldehyde ferredoxin oxidoreductase family protein [Candidatus Korarchaeota archaeon]NIU85670.1 hypothetical protein [Candidatus Thorarchaeota archaeon]NIW15770.1 hypothetical protein [Candidatus Thorarchaeota archaeon]NIW53684.1 hypothetical protein [Candidatus Korarchaeota archaeon]